MSQHFNMWMSSEHENVPVSKRTVHSISTYKYHNWTLEYLNISTCKYVTMQMLYLMFHQVMRCHISTHHMNVSTSQHANVITSQHAVTWHKTISISKIFDCHISTGKCLDVSMWDYQHHNMWIPWQHNTRIPEIWMNHYLPSTFIPLES